MKLFIDSSTNYLYLSLYEHNQEIDSLVRDGKINIQKPLLII